VPVDIRVIAASNVSIAHLVTQGAFLPDLYARIEAFRIRLPALRERRADIPILAQDAVARHAPSCGYRSVPSIAPELMRALCAAPWPHNLRQLDSSILRMLIDAECASVLSLRHCVPELGIEERSSQPDLSDDAIATAVAQAGSKVGAAKLLGVHRTTIQRRHRKTG
jgi:DNA-binding NtrC family response regulator